VFVCSTQTSALYDQFRRFRQCGTSNDFFAAALQHSWLEASPFDATVPAQAQSGSSSAKPVEAATVEAVAASAEAQPTRRHRMWHAAYGKCFKDYRQMLPGQRMSRFPDITDLADKVSLSKVTSCMDFKSCCILILITHGISLLLHRVCLHAISIACKLGFQTTSTSFHG
jgi:hypothetical protein